MRNNDISFQMSQKNMSFQIMLFNIPGYIKFVFKLESQIIKQKAGT